MTLSKLTYEVVTWGLVFAGGFLVGQSRSTAEASSAIEYKLIVESSEEKIQNELNELVERGCKPILLSDVAQGHEALIILECPK